MIHAKTKDTNLHIEGPDDNGHYWLYLSASGETCRIDLGVPRGMVETALLMAASVKFVRSKDDYTLAAPLQRIVEGAKTAPKWDTQADRIAALPARGVGVKPPTLHVTSSMSTSTAPPQDGWHLSFGKGGVPSVMHVRGGTAFCYHDLIEGLQAWAWASAALAPTDAAQAREAALREAAALLVGIAAEKGGTKTPQGRTAQYYARRILALLSEDRT